MILEVLRVNGSRFTAVASQLTKMVQKLDHDGTLTWSVNLSSNWAKLSHLVILICSPSTIPFGKAKMVLPSQASPLDRNLQKF